MAIKIERCKTQHPQLLYESKVYRVLQGGEGVPSLRWFGTANRYNVLVIDRLGKSLEDHFKKSHERFSELTMLYCGKYMVERIEYMHDKHFIHRDIKPDNFMSGYGKNSKTIYIIDFGLSKRYRHPKTKKHINYKEGKSLTGTPRYASINNHLGVEQSRRDDIESIGYVLAYFSRGELPWQGLKAKNKKEKYKRIQDKKMAVPIARLCDKSPECLRKFIEYSRSLRYEDKPNYGYLKLLFSDTMKEMYGEEEHLPQWVKKESLRGGETTTAPPPTTTSVPVAYKMNLLQNI